MTSNLLLLHSGYACAMEKRIIATGSYTNSTAGPGILIVYNSKNEILTVNFASSEKHWSVRIVLRKHSWCHVTAAWSIDNGLFVVLDGKVDDPLSIAEDISGVSRRIVGKP